MKKILILAVIMFSFINFITVAHASADWQKTFLKDFVKKPISIDTLWSPSDKKPKALDGLTSAVITAPNEITVTWDNDLTFNDASSYSNLGMGLLGRSITGVADDGTDFIVLTFDGAPVPANTQGTVEIDDTVAWSGGNFAGGTAEISDGQMPALIMTTFQDLDESNTVTTGDTYDFRFSEPMNKSTITTANVNARLSLSNAHTFGTTGAGMAISWNTAGTILTVTLGSNNTIAAADTSSAASEVTDLAGNFNNTPAPLTLDTTAVGIRTLYFNGADDGNWNNLNNWWNDSDGTDPALSVPTAYDDVVILAPLDSNTSGKIFASVRSFTMTGGTGEAFPLSWLGSSIFISTSEGATLNDHSMNTGTIIGDVEINDSSINGYQIGPGLFFGTGYIIGAVTFNAPTTANYGTITGDTTLHGNFGNAGLIYGDVDFNDFTSDPGTIVGHVNFFDDSFGAYFGYGIIYGDADVYFPAQNPLDGVVSGTITYHGYADAPVLSEVTPIPDKVTIQKAKYYFSVEGDTTSYEYLSSDCGTETIVNPSTHVVSFSGLKVGQTYGDCDLYMTSDLGPDTNSLHINAFTIKSNPSGGGSSIGSTYAHLLAPDLVVVPPSVSGAPTAPEPTTPAVCALISTLKKGSSGAEVKCLQMILGITTDGVFGSKTKNAVMLFQKNNSPLVADGVVGSKTRAKIDEK